MDTYLKNSLLERYQFDIEKESCLVTIYFGRKYEQLKEEVAKELENILNITVWCKI